MRYAQAIYLICLLYGCYSSSNWSGKDNSPLDQISLDSQEEVKSELVFESKIDYIDDNIDCSGKEEVMLDGGLHEEDSYEVENPCGSNILITDEKALIDEIIKVGWKAWGHYTSAHLPITDDLEIQASITVKSTDIPLPEGCVGMQGCKEMVAFYLEEPIQGVVVPNGSEPGKVMFDSLIFDHTTIRLRPLLRDMHPGPYNWVPIVMVLPPCLSSCKEGKVKCPFDHVCYTKDDEYCRLCEVLGKEVCACWTNDGIKADGTNCTYKVSGDVFCSGVCENGICKSKTSGAGCP